MAEPIHIPLSEFQQKRFAQLDAELSATQARKTESLTTIVAGLYDPQQFATWGVTLTATEIICVPPPESPSAA